MPVQVSIQLKKNVNATHLTARRLVSIIFLITNRLHLGFNLMVST
jgi:hypothetical protein